MFFFKNSAMSNDQKSFYDLEIESINGEIIKLKDYRDKVCQKPEHHQEPITVSRHEEYYISTAGLCKENIYENLQNKIPQNHLC